MSVVLGLIAYQLTRSYLLDKRVDLARQEAFLNAQYLDRALPEAESVPELLAAVAGRDRPIVLESDGQWYGATVGIGAGDLPEGTRSLVGRSRAASQVVTVDGRPTVVVGTPLPATDARFYQLFPMTELPATLDAMRNALVIAAAITTFGSAVIGLLISRRMMRPLRRTAAAAERIAGGDLDARLATEGDPDLDPLVTSFNSMVSALAERIERERRFAGDVSHELRTPLTSLNAAVHVLERRSSELGPTGQEALETLGHQVDRFTRMVLEILEVARLESGSAELHEETVPTDAVLTAAIEEARLDPSVLDVAPDVPGSMTVDVRRLRVVLRNVLENAERYAGGCVRLGASVDGSDLVIEVDDRGPGIPESERSAVFERFRRGSTARPEGTPRGSGLGLALVSENVNLLGGRIELGCPPHPGTRVSLRLPLAGQEPAFDAAAADAAGAR